MKAWVLRVLAHRRAPWLAAAVAMALSLPSLSKGFLVDDWVHRVMFLREPGVWSGSANMFAFAPPSALDLAFPWWATPDLRLSLFRPLAGFTHYLDYQLWPDSPWLMHFHSVAWYGAAVLAIGMLFQRLMASGWIAGLAALIYGISYTHAIPVMFIANRNSLIGVTLSAVALILHHAWRANGNSRAALASSAALLLALFGNEGAVATLGYLMAYAWMIDRAPVRSRMIGLLPAMVVIAVWRVVYSSLGHGAWGSEAYIDPVASPLRFFQAAIVRGPILLNGQWLLPPADFWAVVPWLEQRWAAAAALALAGLAALLWPMLRRDRASRFWAIGMLLSIVPACATFPMNRLLMHAGIGFAAILAQFIAFATSADFAATTSLVRRLITRVTVDVLIATHLILTWLWFPVMIQVTAGSFHASTQGVEQLAQRPDLAGKIVVLVDDVLGSGAYFPAFRDLAGLLPPAQFLVLSPAMERNAPLVVTRESDRTLVVEHQADYPWFLERDDLHPFSAGDQVLLGSVSVEVRSVKDGKPVVVAFHSIALSMIHRSRGLAGSNRGSCCFLEPGSIRPGRRRPTAARSSRHDGDCLATRNHPRRGMPHCITAVIYAMALAHTRVTAQGQVSVPAKVRQRLGIGPGSVLAWDDEGDRVVVRKAGLHTSEDIHRAMFSRTPARRTVREMKQGIRRHIKKRHAVR